MKCARCHRQLDKVAGYAAGLPVGPVCFKKMFGFVPRVVKSSRCWSMKSRLIYSKEMQNEEDEGA